MLKRIWDSAQNWYKKREVIIRQKEAEKWSFDMREKDMKLILLQSSEVTCHLLNKHEILESVNNL